jgi:SAM-dependent methyltransferase
VVEQTVAASGFRKWVHHQMFDPGVLGAFVNPFYLSRRDLAAAMRGLAGNVRGRVLDVGCGQKPYARMFNFSEYVGVEVDTPENRAQKRAEVYYDGKVLPFGDAEFDTVLCNQVLEHVFEPDAFVTELARVLRPGGTLVLTVPFVWDEHEQPWDYARYSSFGLRHLLSKHGFEIGTQRKTLANVGVLFQLFNAYLYKITRARSRLLNFGCTVVLMGPISLIGAGIARILPGNPDLYLDNIVAARKIDGAAKA